MIGGIISTMTSTFYTPELAAKFCAALASSSDSIATICKRKGMPSKATVFRWRNEIPEFRTMYEAAKEDQLYAGIEECTEIADGAPLTTEGIQKAKLRIYARLEVAQRLKPKTLGSKTQLTGDGGGPIEHMLVTQMTDEQLLAIAARKVGDAADA